MKKYLSYSDKLKKYRILCILLAALLAVSAGLLISVGVSTATKLHWVVETIKENYYVAYEKDDIYDALLKGKLFSGSTEGLLDIYSAYYDAEEYKSLTAERGGSKAGIGISTNGVTNRIVQVLGNSPAERAGVKRGSYLAGFGMTEDSITYSYDYADFSAFFVNLDENENFYLYTTVDKNGNGGTLHLLAREQYSQNYVFYASNDSSYSMRVENNAFVLTETNQPYEALPDDTAYIRLDQFYGQAASQLEAMLTVFKSEGKQRLIFDLRNNGGGYMDVCCDIASCFLKESDSERTLISLARYRGGKTQSFYADENNYYEYFTDETEITVLCNVNSASASEVLIGAMIDYGAIEYSDIYVTELNGVARTYGKGIMQTTHYHPVYQCAIKLTVAEIFWPVSDRSIHGVGITPDDGANAVFAEDIVTYHDDELLSVLDRLQG